MQTNWQDLVWKVFFGTLAVFFGGWFLGGTLNLAAAATPQTASPFFCPAGSLVSPDPHPAAGDQTPFPILCREQNGTLVPPLSAAESEFRQREYLFTPSYIIMTMLVAGWFLRPLWRRLPK